MNLIDCLSPERTKYSAQAASKKRALEVLSQILADSSDALEQEDVLESLNNRERLGCTAIGNHIAIPHGRCSPCQQPVCAMMTLAEAIDYDAPDQKPVDILLAVLVPESADSEHLKLLSGFASLLQSESFCRKIRNAYNDETLFTIIKQALEQQPSELRQ